MIKMMFEKLKKASFLVPFVITFVNGMEEDRGLWPTTPAEAYKELMTYQEEVKTRCELRLEQRKLSFDDVSFETYINEGFKPLKDFHQGVQCTKMTIKNMTCNIKIMFGSNYRYKTVGVNTDPHLGKKARYAYRAIRPGIFGEWERMDCLENLIDGGEEDFSLNKFILYVNSDPKEAPIKILFENIQGTIEVIDMPKGNNTLAYEESDELKVTYKTYL